MFSYLNIPVYCILITTGNNLTINSNQIKFRLKRGQYKSLNKLWYCLTNLPMDFYYLLDNWYPNHRYLSWKCLLNWIVFRSNPNNKKFWCKLRDNRCLHSQLHNLQCLSLIKYFFLIFIMNLTWLDIYQSIPWLFHFVPACRPLMDLLNRLDKCLCLKGN